MRRATSEADPPKVALPSPAPGQLRTRVAGLRWRWIVLCIVLVAVFAVGNIALLATVGDRAAKKTIGEVGAPASVADRLDIAVDVRELDVATGDMTIRFLVTPVGDLAGGGARLAHDVVLETPSASQPSIELAKGQTIQETALDVQLRGDDITEYPFDEHQASLFFAATRSDGSRQQSIPVRMTVDAGSHLWRFKLQPQARSASDSPRAELVVRRSGGTMYWVWFMIIAMWVLAVGVLAIAVRRIKQPGPFGFWTLTWMASMIFALASFRNAAPGSPPIGSLIDFAAFFWAEFLVAIGLVITMSGALRDSPDPARGAR